MAESHQESEQAIRAIVANLQNRPHVIVKERGWAPIALSFLLGLALFPLAAYVALPAWREHRDHAEKAFIIAELKKIPSAISEPHHNE